MRSTPSREPVIIAELRDKLAGAYVDAAYAAPDEELLALITPETAKEQERRAAWLRMPSLA